MSTVNNKSPKHIWSREETILVTRAYLEGKSIQEACDFTPNIKLTSIKMKYANCLYLDKGPVHLALKNYSKLHKEVWDELNSAFAVPDVDIESTIESVDTGYWDDAEEDGETYNVCSGTCGRVYHYEETDADGMCGTCQYLLSKGGSKKRK